MESSLQLVTRARTRRVSGAGLFSLVILVSHRLPYSFSLFFPFRLFHSFTLSCTPALILPILTDAYILIISCSTLVTLVSVVIRHPSLFLYIKTRLAHVSVFAFFLFYFIFFLSEPTNIAVPGSPTRRPVRRRRRRREYSVLVRFPSVTIVASLRRNEIRFRLLCRNSSLTRTVLGKSMKKTRSNARQTLYVLYIKDTGRRWIWSRW